jgi:hypothetical protein
MARYLRSGLIDLNFPPNGPTLIYEDNLFAIQIINARQPTDRSRHIDIQYFAIQDWKDNGDILLAHIPGVINPADDLRLGSACSPLSTLDGILSLTCLLVDCLIVFQSGEGVGIRTSIVLKRAYPRILIFFSA